MKAKNVPISVLVVGGLVLVASTANDAVTIASIALLATALLAVKDYITQQTLARHQEALEWFADHIYTRPNQSPADRDEEIDNILGKEHHKN